MTKRWHSGRAIDIMGFAIWLDNGTTIERRLTYWNDRATEAENYAFVERVADALNKAGVE